MNILLLVASNSGSTFEACDLIKPILTAAGLIVIQKNPNEATFDDLNKADAVILASPSWDYLDKEGQPHEDFFPLIESMKGKTLEGKPFAILGLGDIYYTHFNGAVDIFEKWITDLKGKLIVPSLRVDRFYSERDSHEKVTSWGELLAKALTT